jgi:hypothetical protein
MAATPRLKRPRNEDVMTMIQKGLIPAIAARDFWRHREWARICRKRVGRLRDWRGNWDDNSPIREDIRYTYPKYAKARYDGYVGNLWKKLLTLGCSLVPEMKGLVSYGRWKWDPETAEKRKEVGKILLLTEKARWKARARLGGLLRRAAHYRVWEAVEELMAQECNKRNILFQRSNEAFNMLVATRALIEEFPESVRGSESMDVHRAKRSYELLMPMSGGDLNYMLSKFRHNIAFDSDDYRDKAMREVLKDALERDEEW